jgi:hypothetical protein
MLAGLLTQAAPSAAASPAGDTFVEHGAPAGSIATAPSSGSSAASQPFKKRRKRTANSSASKQEKQLVHSYLTHEDQKHLDFSPEFGLKVNRTLSLQRGNKYAASNKVVITARSGLLGRFGDRVSRCLVYLFLAEYHSYYRQGVSSRRSAESSS